MSLTRNLLRPFLSGLLLAAGAAAQDPTEVVRKEAVPDEAALKKADTELRELIKADFKSTDPADRRALAKKLLGGSGGADPDLAVRYVVLRMAADVAAQAEDLGTAFIAIDRIGGQFEVDPFGLKASAVETARKVARRTDVLARIAGAGIRLAREARAADRLEPAQRALKEAETAARGARDAALSKAVVEETKLLAAARKDLAEVEEARTKLAGTPDDARANLVVGLWLAFGKGLFKEGLPHLAKGSDKKLAEAAKLDLEGFDALRIGESWMKVSGDPRLSRSVLLQRSSEWLKKAWDAEDTLGRERLRTRIMAILTNPRGKAQADTAPAGWNIMGGQSKTAWDSTLAWSGERSVKLMMAAKAGNPAFWTGFYTARLPAVPGAEYHISVRVLTEKDQGPNGQASNGVWILFYGLDPKPLKEVSFMFPSDTPVWSRVEGKVECPPGATHVEVSFHHDAPGGAFWIDGVSLLCQGDEVLANGDFEGK